MSTTAQSAGSAESTHAAVYRPPLSAAPKLAMLTALYFLEGMPWGFQAKVLPLFMRTHHASLIAIGLLNLLSLPWMLKAIWAPLVDRYASERFGVRKSWIVPMQALISLTCLLGAFAARSEHLLPIIVLVGFMNLFSATMDIAVDGLAVDLLDEKELGTGNIAQVVGYKFGTLTAGGLLVYATASLGWSALFFSIACIAAVICVVTALFPEPTKRVPAVETPAPEQGAYRTNEKPGEAPEKLSFKRIATLLWASMKTPGMLPLLLMIATYKTGEQLIDAMFKPFLIDKGFSVAQVALWVSTFGMVASMTGSFLGGVLASRMRIVNAVSFAAVFRAVPVFLVFLLTLHQPTRTEVIVAALAENFFGGLLTTTVFAYMMARTDKRIGATHFTLLSTVEMIGKAPIPLLAGPIAQYYGFSVLFGAGTALSAAFLLVLPSLRRADTRRLEEEAKTAAAQAEGA